MSNLAGFGGWVGLAPVAVPGVGPEFLELGELDVAVVHSEVDGAGEFLAGGIVARGFGGVGSAVARDDQAGHGVVANFEGLAGVEIWIGDVVEVGPCVHPA